MWLIDNEVVTIWGMFIFITFNSYICHSWLMTKWRGHPIVIIIIKKWLQAIWYEHRQPYPLTYLCTYMSTYPPTHMLTYLLIYPPNHLFNTYLSPTYLPYPTLPTYLLTFPCTQPPAYIPSHTPTGTYPPTHNPPTYLLT
jgi:hypothetical protein